MKLATLVYNWQLRTKGAVGLCCSIIRKLLIKYFNDPSCVMTVHGHSLEMPLSHALPEYLACHRFYDRLPERLSEHLHQKHKALRCIDVGANIGDTIAAMYGDSNDSFMAIEPSETFLRYLNLNWGKSVNVDIRSVICSSVSGIGNYEAKEGRGTASIRQVASGDKKESISLDSLMTSGVFAEGVDILKIDTDGYDHEVLAGAAQLLKRWHPAVLYECDEACNEKYVEECISTLTLLQGCGYQHFLLYDNFGNLMGMNSMNDLACFRNLLFFQLTGCTMYFDILTMQEKDLISFFESEIHFYVDSMKDKQMQRTAKAALK